MPCLSCGRWVKGVDNPSTLSPSCECSETFDYAVTTTSILRHDMMVAIAKYMARRRENGDCVDDVETDLIEEIAMSTGGRIELSR